MMKLKGVRKIPHTTRKDNNKTDKCNRDDIYLTSGHLKAKRAFERVVNEVFRNLKSDRSLLRHGTRTIVKLKIEIIFDYNS